MRSPLSGLGGTGQLLVVPKKGDFITRPDPYVTQLHDSPWPYVHGPYGEGGAVLDGGRCNKTSRRRSPPRSQAQANFIPTNTAVGHSTISTGADPGAHGITGVSTYDWEARRRDDMFAGCAPQDLLALTLADVWQRATAGRAVILAQEASTEGRRPSPDMVGACKTERQSCSRATINKRAPGTRIQRASGCPII